MCLSSFYFSGGFVKAPAFCLVVLFLHRCVTCLGIGNEKVLAFWVAWDLVSVAVIVDI